MMSKNLKITVFILLGVLLVGITAAAVIIISGMSGEHSEQLGELEAENQQLESEGAKLGASVSELESEKAALEEEIERLKTQLSDAEASYTDELTLLRADIDAKSVEIAGLEADIAKYRTVFNIDVRAQARLIDEIIEYIETECPYVRITAAEGGEDAESSSGEYVLLSTLIEEERGKLAPGEALFTPEELEASGLTSAEFTEKKLRDRVYAREDVDVPSVSVYYEDLATGYHFDYNADKAYNSASVVKAPYIMSVLEVISKEEQNYLKALSNGDQLPEQIDTDGDGTPDKIKIEYSDPKYDLSEKVIYDKATMYKSGSGKIMTMEDGTEFTYLDFVKYTLEYSDNIAYAQLRSRFGYSTMTALASRAGANIAYSTMTAKGAGKLFKEIYEFIEHDELYGPVMYDSMRKSNHTVIIPAGVPQTTVLHKYGWDTGAYHDAAIVLAGDQPYVLAVFSDLDKGGNEVNAYLRGIVQMISRLHSGFYNS